MNEVQDNNESSIFPVQKYNPAELNPDEVAAIMRLGETYDLSQKALMKLLISYRNRKRDAYAQRRKK